MKQNAFKLFSLSWIFLFSVQLHAQFASDEVNKLYDEALAAIGVNDFRSAEKSIHQAIKLDESNSMLYCHLGDIKSYQEDYAASFEAYSKAIELDRRNNEAYNQRGQLLTNLGEFELAIQDFSTAIDVAPTDSCRGVYHGNRAIPKSLMRNFEGAYQDLMVSYKIDPTDLETLINLGAVCDDVGREEEGLKYLEYGRTLYPDNLELRGNLAFRHMMKEDYKLAIQLFTENIAQDPQDGISLNNRAYCNYKLGDLTIAMEDVNKSLKLYETNAFAYRNRALILLALKKNKEACKDLSKALEFGFTQMYGTEVEELQRAECK